MMAYFGSVCALGMLVLSAGSPAHAQGGTRESDLMEARSIKLSSATMYYRLFKPKNYDATKKYPVVVCLHGVGERGTDNRKQVDNEDLAHPWIEDSIQARVPHFVMVPQCPPDPMTWSNNSGGTLSETGKGIIDVLEGMKKEFSLDSNRFYITGLSMGGAGTYHQLQMKPGYWAAAVPCAAGGSAAAITTIAKTPLWHHHGSLDGNPPGGRTVANALEGAGYKVVRFVSQAAFTKPELTTYSNALKNGTKPESLSFKSPTPPVTYDSLKRAVEQGVPYLYSEVTGGDHRSGWMIAWHNPLLAKWLFSKVRGGNSVSLAPKAAEARPSRNAALLFGTLPAGSAGRLFSLNGQSLDAAVRVAGPGAHGPLLMVQPIR
jgi:predicted peptidase